MKKVCSLALALACIISGFAPQAQAKPDYQLTLNLPIPPVHTRWTGALKPWTEEIEKRSGGRIVVETFFAEALSPRSEAYESVRSGIADLTESGFEANAGQFPFHEGIMSILSPGRDLSSPLPLLQGLHQKYPQVLKEVEGVKLLFCHVGPTLVIGTKSRPINNLEELKGMKINANSSMIAERLKKLGVSVVSMPLSDVYTAMEQGVIDGTTLPYELLVSRRFGDQVRYGCNLSTQNTLFYMVMNQDVYDSMPADLQKVIDEVSGEFADKLFEDYWNAVEFSAVESWKTNMGGQEMVVLSDADYAKAQEMMQPPVDAWFKMLSDKLGLPGDEIKASYYELEAANSSLWKESPLYKHYQNIAK